MKSGIEQDWRELAQDRSAWHRVVEMRIDTINKVAQQEGRKKDERKRTQQSHVTAALAGFACDLPNCTFTASNQAVFVNHKH